MPRSTVVCFSMVAFPSSVALSACLLMVRDNRRI